MKFGEFIKELRETVGLTQEQMADTLHINIKTYEGYESCRRTCTFDFGMEILSKLNVSVLLKENTIIVEKGELKMTKQYKDMGFENFDAKEYINNVLLHRNNLMNGEAANFEEIRNKLISQGFDCEYYTTFDPKCWLDEHYDNNTRLASFTKDGRTMSIMINGYLDMKMFIFERFIELIAKYSKGKKSQDIANFIEKEILYYQKTQDRGTEIFDAFYRKNFIEIFRIAPISKIHKDVISKVLDEHFDELFVTIDFGYDPTEISISNELEMYDCFSTPYIHFVYEMEDGEEILCYEHSFDGHSVIDAINSVPSYFNEFNDYVAEYNHLDEDWEDSQFEITVL